LDTGAQGGNYIHPQTAQLLSSFAHSSIQLITLDIPKLVQGFDGQLAPPITQKIVLSLQVGRHYEEQAEFYLLNLGSRRAIIGIEWMTQHGAILNTVTQEVLFLGDYCKHIGAPPIVPFEEIDMTTQKEPLKADGTNPSKEVNQPTPLLAKQSVNQIALIGAAAMKHLLKKPSSEVLVVSMRDIMDQEYKRTHELDPKDAVPIEFHKHLQAFSKSDADELPPLRGDAIDHKIQLTDIPNWAPRLYRMSKEEHQEVQEWVRENLSKGFIEASSAPWASPIIFVKKPGGGVRLCVDYRKLNAITKRDRYVLPLIDDIMTLLSGCQIMTRLDIRHAFNRLRIRQGDEELTTFATPMGNYQSKVLPFGLTGGPATFQRYINSTLVEYLNQFVTAYMDDVIIFSKSKEEHIEHVNQVLQKLQEAGLQVDVRKSEFMVTETKFLGLIISTKGLKMDNEKIQVIQEWNTPTSLLEVQSFVGFCNFYRRFIKDFSKILRPLIELTKKSQPFNWSPQCQEAFEYFKEQVTKAPILLHFDYTKQCYLEVDSSDYVQGGVLSQKDNNGLLHPVAFFSRKLLPAECNYEIYDKELLAIVNALEHWRPELEGTELPIQILTDHKALEYFMTTKKLNRRQARWALDLANYNFQITYQSGKKNSKADALTRLPGSRPQEDSDERQQYQFQTILNTNRLAPELRDALQAIKRGEPASLAPIGPELNIDMVDRESPLEYNELIETRVRKAQIDDQTYLRVKKSLEDKVLKDPEFTLADCKIIDQSLFVQDRLWVPESIRTELIQESHNTPVTGHPGIAKTLFHLKKSYYWINMHQAVAQYIRNCYVCKRTKPSREQYHGSLRPLPIAEQPWKHISIDFITKLPDTRSGFDTIVVIVCRLSKRRLFFPTTESGLTAEATAKLVYLQMRRLGVGLISSQLSDRGTQFDNEFWTHLARLWKVKRLMSTAFHPETDGQTEIANQELERYLRAYTSYQQDDWDEWLIEAEAAINSHPSETTKLSPFFVTNGYEPSNQIDLQIHESLPQSDSKKDRARAELFAQDCLDRYQFCQEQISLSQSRMEQFANKSRQPAPNYQPGNYIWLNLKNIKTQRPSKKLDDKSALCKVIERVGNNAYRLELPAGMTRIHDVFHTSLLRPDTDDPLPRQSNEPQPAIQVEDDEGIHEEWEVEDILDSKMMPYGRLVYRVKWKGFDQPDLRWYNASGFKNASEIIDHFHQKYPEKPRSLRIKQQVLDKRVEERAQGQNKRILRARKARK
jgi:hypothetical protein